MSDLMESVQGLRESWNMAVVVEDTSCLDNSIKTEMQQHVEELNNFYKTKCVKLDYPVSNCTIQEFWGFGGIYLPSTVLSVWQRKYPWLDVSWVVNTLLFRTKWLVLKKSVLESANRQYKGGPAIFDPSFIKQRYDSKYFDLVNSYRKRDWDLADLTIDGDKENPDIKSFLSGELTMVSRGFCDIGRDFRVTPLFPQELIDIGFCNINCFGTFGSGFFCQFK